MKHNTHTNHEFRKYLSCLQLHVMRIAVSYTRYLNPGQVAVGGSDQPLYAIKKMIQWAMGEEFSHSYFAFMGGLHLEKVSLVCVGQLIKGTGLDTILTSANLNITGLTTAVCDVNSIKKARYCIQLLAVVLAKKRDEAFQAKRLEDNSLTWSNWVANENSPMFHYWNNVVDTIKKVLIFIRSFREANFIMMISALEQLIPLFFALDHTHYARWASVFLQDLKELKWRHPYLFKEFLSGSFTVNTRDNPFSKIACDQKQEHNIKVIKSDTGYVDIINREDQEFFRKLELALPEIQRYLDEVEGQDPSHGHKEMLDSFKETFSSHTLKVYQGILTNPFDEAQFMRLNSSIPFPDVISKDSSFVFTVGKTQHDQFVQERIVLSKKDVNATISRNALKLPSSCAKVQLASPAIKPPKGTFAKLKEACRSREEETRKLFGGEFTGLPDALSTKDGDIYHSQKSQILKDIGVQVQSTSSEGLVIDLSVQVRIMAKSLTKGMTFQDFVIKVLNSIARIGHEKKANRIDIVADLYQNMSIKTATRKNRGSAGSSQMAFSENDTMPESKQFFEAFLSNVDNKVALNLMFARIAKAQAWNWDKEFSITYGRKVLANFGESFEIQLYDSIDMLEEADNRIVCHVMHMLNKGIKSVTVRTVDSDVVVILLGFTTQFLSVCNDLQLIVDFAVPGKRQFYSITEAHKKLGGDVADAMPVFHSFSGCDSVSAFFGHSKTAQYKAWINHSKSTELTAALRGLSCCPSIETVKESMEVIEPWVMSWYNKTGLYNCVSIDELRFQLFKHSVNDELRDLPPSQDALLQHLLRATFQAGWLWGNSLLQLPCPPVIEWGWTTEGEELFVKWSTVSTRDTLSQVTGVCSCRSNKCTSCSCAGRGMKCLIYCKCLSKCLNPV